MKTRRLVILVPLLIALGIIIGELVISQRGRFERRRLNQLAVVQPPPRTRPGGEATPRPAPDDAQRRNPLVSNDVIAARRGIDSSGSRRAPLEKDVDAASDTTPPSPSVKNTAAPIPPHPFRTCRALHAFYYPWYANETVDGKWLHWNHVRLPHWDASVTNSFPKAPHKPPNDVGSAFYPAEGPYSSADRVTVCKHTRQAAAAGVGVFVVSWYPPDKSDDNGQPFDKLMPTILNCAQEAGIYVAIHSEPYGDRTEKSLRSDLEYLVKQYGTHPALFRTGPSMLPVIYVYDPYHVAAENWAKLFHPDHRAVDAMNVRGTAYDFVAIALILNADDTEKYLGVGGFDGGYSYFASNTFTFASAYDNWRTLVQDATSRQATHHDRMDVYGTKGGVNKVNHATTTKFFVPCPGPGYDDTPVRPWNAVNKKSREGGRFYRRALQSALEAHGVAQLTDGAEAPADATQQSRAATTDDVARWSPSFVAVTSWNEWHEGTQIEPASIRPPARDSPFASDQSYFVYDDAQGRPREDFYLELTREFVDRSCHLA